MLKTKKIISSVLALCFMSSITTSYQALENNAETYEYVSQESEISPRYVNLGNITAGMSINSDNKAECNGSFFLYNSNKSKIIVSLLVSTDGKTNWTAVDGERWTDTFTTSGNHVGGGTSSCTLSSDYYYCSHVQVNVYDSNDNVIETVTLFSKVYHL